VYDYLEEAGLEDVNVNPSQSAPEGELISPPESPNVSGIASKKKSKTKKQKAVRVEEVAPVAEEPSSSVEPVTLTWEGQMVGVQWWHLCMLLTVVLLIAHLTRDVVTILHRGKYIALGTLSETFVRAMMGAFGTLGVNLSTVFLFPKQS